VICLLAFVFKQFEFEIWFSDHCRKSYLPARLSLATARRALEGVPATVLRKHLSRSSVHRLQLIFVGEKKIQQLNREFRKKNRPTDVLSFSRIEFRGLKKWVLPEVEIGDVVVCPRVAARNAGGDKIKPREEIQKLIVHGVLHLFGYDHERDRAGAKRMFLLQDKILTRE
jgi:probable rRNA maturation factor